MNYTQIIAAIADLVHRDDLTAAIPTFIILAESEMRRTLRVRQMEVDLAETPIVNGGIALAANILDVKHLMLSGVARVPLDRQPFESVVASAMQGPATMYARTGPSGLIFNGAGSVIGKLFQQIPALQAAGTNWLSQEAPDVYIYGALKQASIYLKEDPGAYASQYQVAVVALSEQDNRYAGPMRTRTR
jgi:hypothetical protein